ncbi:MAG: PadR family transcriptional regulator [Candidatus Thorarchaeota archaeon]|nr:PadR family transcriptional regulator [Candidatus Thorarchaeota archaeon]
MSIRPFLPTGGKITPMQLLIFIQLLEGPKYGYEILKNLREAFEDVWVPKTGTVYPALKTLVKKGLISETEIKDTTYYKMTKSGKDLVQDHKELVRDYVLFNYQFMSVAVERLPADFTESLLMSLYEFGIDDIIPERTILDAMKSIPDLESRRYLLENRKRVLLDKLKVIKNEIRLIDSEETNES